MPRLRLAGTDASLVYRNSAGEFVRGQHGQNLTRLHCPYEFGAGAGEEEEQVAQGIPPPLPQHPGLGPAAGGVPGQVEQVGLKRPPQRDHVASPAADAGGLAQHALGILQDLGLSPDAVPPVVHGQQHDKEDEEHGFFPSLEIDVILLARANGSRESGTTMTLRTKRVRLEGLDQAKVDKAEHDSPFTFKMWKKYILSLAPDEQVLLKPQNQGGTHQLKVYVNETKATYMFSSNSHWTQIIRKLEAASKSEPWSAKNLGEVISFLLVPYPKGKKEKANKLDFKDHMYMSGKPPMKKKRKVQLDSNSEEDYKSDEEESSESDGKEAKENPNEKRR